MLTVNEYAMYVLDKLPGNDVGYSWEFYTDDQYDYVINGFVIQHGPAVLEVREPTPAPMEHIALFGPDPEGLIVRFKIGDDDSTCRGARVSSQSVDEAEYLIRRLIDMSNAFNPA